MVGLLDMFGLDRGRFRKLDFIYYFDITNPLIIRISNPMSDLCIIKTENL